MTRVPIPLSFQSAVLLLFVLFVARHTAHAFQAAAFRPVARILQNQAHQPLLSLLSSQQRVCHLCRKKLLPTPTRLFSLNKLIQAVESSKQKPSTIFVGGKGGVGKSTVSSSLAVHLASTNNNPDFKVLIVSTDPAHSLGDALDVDLRPHHGKATCLTDSLTQGRLYAQEVDASAALAEFRENLAAFDIGKLAETLQVSPELLETLGLQDFSGLLQNPPPGLDELVALSNVFETESKFDVVIVDTAPTGHTLRLLALPQFVDGLLGKLIQLRLKLAGIASKLQAFLGSSEEASQRAVAIDDAVSKLEKFKTKMSRLRSNLQNAETTRFVVVTVPTILSVAESKRLVNELQSQSVSVTDIVVNQCVVLASMSSSDKEQDQENDTALHNYFERRVTGQLKWIGKMEEAVQKVSNAAEFKNNGSPAPIAITQVPFFDVELVGVPALGYVGSQVYLDNPHFSHLMTDRRAANAPPKVVICGGKGRCGVQYFVNLYIYVTMAPNHVVARLNTFCRSFDKIHCRRNWEIYDKCVAGRHHGGRWRPQGGAD